MCNIVTEFYLYSIVYYIYLINSRLELHSVLVIIFVLQTLSMVSTKYVLHIQDYSSMVGVHTNKAVENFLLFNEAFFWSFHKL